MKKIVILSTGALLCTAVVAFSAPVPSSEASTVKTGEALFKEHCAVCHPDGGNIVNPKRTLHKKDREANKVNTKTEIVGLMRKPGPGMSVFDVKILPDRDAHEIAEYILKTFNK